MDIEKGGSDMQLPPAERRLAAIVVADMVGYSRLVESDEAGTLTALRDLRNRLLRPLSVHHRGRIVKSTGDGFIAEFGSIVDAVAFSAALQTAIAEWQRKIASEPRIALRIGVNLGDVVVEDDDLFGDGVNVAARLEQICPPGSVVISGTAYDHLSGKLDVRFEYAGEQRLKNIARPIKAYQMAIPGFGSALPQSVRVDQPTIAVLPFENMSGDPEQAYFSDGITEDVITELSRFKELMVIARNSTVAFRERQRDLRNIGRLLSAGYLVEGSIRWSGGRVRITAQLVDAVSGVHLWAERYDRAIEDVFAIQEEIAQSIVATVAQRVRISSELAARRRPPEDIRAYDLFLQAQRISDVFTPEAQQQTQALLERAIRIDPTFARAYTGLAFVSLKMDEEMWAPLDWDHNRMTALNLAEQALSHDPNDPRVQYTIGFMCLWLRDFDRAERHLDLAKYMNPNDPIIQMIWAFFQACAGKPELGLPAAQTALRINPHHPLFYKSLLARVLFQFGDYAEAASLLQQRNFGTPVRDLWDTGWRAAAYGHLGRIDEAQQCGGLFIASISRLWRGKPNPGVTDFVNWVVDRSFLRHPEDAARLREGLRLAGLPA